MKEPGIVRRIDKAGRVAIPMQIRQVAGWTARMPIEISIGEDGIVLLRPYVSPRPAEASKEGTEQG